MRRRDVLRAGPVVALGAVLPLSFAAFRSIELVYDGGYAPARMLAAAAPSAHALPADPLAVWRRVSAAPRVAGLTNYADMLMFADLARGDGRRMTMRVAHSLASGQAGHIAHVGPRVDRVLDAAGNYWPLALWGLFGGGDVARAVEQDGRSGTLWSWLID